MKKLLSVLCALTLTVSLAACGDKDSSSEKESSSNSSASPDYDSNNDIPTEEEAKAFEKIAGTYYADGYGKTGKAPEKFDDMYAYEDIINEEGVTRSEDGKLSIEGEEYQLTAQKLDADKMIFSVAGCGFSLNEYEKRMEAASDEYEGFAVLEYTEQPITANGEEISSYVSLELKYSPKGNRSTPVSISLGTDKPESNYKEPMNDDEKDKALKTIAGSYTYSYGYCNSFDHTIERYEDPSSDEVKKIFENDPVTISESGVLHFDGKDYQLEAQEFGPGTFGDDEGIFSVEGCGFSMKEYKQGIGLDVSSEDYSGAALVKYSVSSMTINGEELSSSSITVYVTDDTSTSAHVSLTFNREDQNN